MMRAVAITCVLAALAAIVYVGISGERWPLAFVGTMVAGSLIFGAGEAFIGRNDDD